MNVKVVLLVLLFPFYCYKQNRNSVWIFGDSASINFNGNGGKEFRLAIALSNQILKLYFKKRFI